MRCWRSQPAEQGLAVGRVEDVVQGVLAVRFAHALCGGEQVQVVVAQQAGGGIAEPLEPAQRGQRGGPAVDQVAEQVEPVAGRGEVDFLEQPL